jgi:hypothetical protein
MPDFVSGLKLSGLFYSESVKPILGKYFPRLRYSAAVIGWGSEVLGFDDETSTDHHWGPRLLLFLSEKDNEALAGQIDSTLAEELPYTFRGYSTNFSEPESNGVRHPAAISAGKIRHMVQCLTIRQFFQSRLGVDPQKRLTAIDWLTIPQQRLLEVTSGAVYCDGLGQLENARQKFGYYPHDIWLYLLSNQWKKISQEEAFVGRTGSVGDELGSRIIASRLVREMMLLCFLMERRYAPYSKWLGSAFAKLKNAKKLIPIFERLLQADNWKERERKLSAAYSLMARSHNELKITAPMPTRTSKYFNRPFKVIHADAFADAIGKEITDRAVRRLRRFAGSIDQFVDSTDVLCSMDACRSFRGIY